MIALLGIAGALGSGPTAPGYFNEESPHEDPTTDLIATAGGGAEPSELKWQGSKGTTKGITKGTVTGGNVTGGNVTGGNVTEKATEKATEKVTEKATEGATEAVTKAFNISYIFNAIVIITCLLLIYCLVFISVNHYYNTRNNIAIDQLPSTSSVDYFAVKGQLRTGDLMLVRSDRNYSKKTAIIFNTIGDVWSHIGFIYVHNNVPYVITSRDRNERFTMLKNYINYETPPNVDPEQSIGYSFEGGVSMHKLDDEMTWYNLGARGGIKKAKIGFKTLRPEIPEDQTNLQLITFLKNNPIKKYRTSAVYIFGKLLDLCNLRIFNGLHSNDRAVTGVICSEITAELLKTMGVLKKEIDTRWVVPSDFELKPEMYTNEKIYNPTIVCNY